MNVCYIITSTIKCGPVNVLYGIVKNYKTIKKFKPCIITLKSDCPDRSMRKSFRELGINVAQFDMIKDFNQIVNFLEKNNCQIIHSHGLKPDLLNKKIQKKYPNKYKHVTTLHNYPFKDYILANGHVKGLLMSFLQLYADYSLYKVGCSNAIRDQYKKIYNIDVVENGVVFSKLKNNELYLNKGKPIFLYLGGIQKRKHVEFLLNYFEFHPEYEFWIVGNGLDGSFDRIKKKSEKINNIKFFGRTEKPYKFYKKVDFFVSDSEAEGLPMSVLESLSYGVPCIISNIPAHLEIIKKSDCFGKIFKLDNGNDLNLKIKESLRNQYDKLYIQKKAQEYFSANLMMKKYLAIYNKLLDS